MGDMSLFNDMRPDDTTAMLDFLLYNSMEHRQIAKIIEQRGKSVNAFPLTDIGNVEDWLETHSFIHAQEFSVIGLTGLPDLTDVDFKDPEQLSDWMYLHSGVHAAVNQALDIVP